MDFRMAERPNKDGSYVGVGYLDGERLFAYCDKGGKVIEKGGQELIFKSLGAIHDGWRTVEARDGKRGYISPELELFLFEAKNVSDVEYGFGKVGKKDGKSYFFNLETKSLDETGYADAFIIGEHTRIVGDEKNGWRILPYKVSAFKEVKVYHDLQEAISEANEFELGLKIKLPRRKCVVIPKDVMEKYMNDGDAGLTV